MAEVNVSTQAPDGKSITPQTGSVGLQSQVPGQSSTVGGLAEASGGVAPGNLVETDLDEQLFRFQSEDTALMSLMLKAKKVKVASPEVEHYMIDEQRATLTTSDEVAASTQFAATTFKLPLEENDRGIARQYSTLLLCGVDGYKPGTTDTTPGRDLMVFVVDIDTATQDPICRCINGPTKSGNTLCGNPTIPAGTKVKLLANAMYETQKEVDPDLIIPQPSLVYLQKRGMNQIVSDYFEAQKKHIHFTQAMIAEQAILNFKRAGNRTLWAGQKGKIAVNVPKLGQQYVYFTEGIRWQFKQQYNHSGKWTIEKLIGLAKMFYTGEDVPKSALLLAGKNLLEEIQCIDFSKHPEVSIAPFKHPTVGWEVTRIHTVFGDILIKREPTLDTLGWSNSGALIGEDRLVHYTYSAQHEFSDRVEGEEATRKGMVVWDALCLKGCCHIWINGDNDETSNGVIYSVWETSATPTVDDVVSGTVYYFLADTVLNDATTAQSGTMWKATITTDTTTELTWTEYTGDVLAN